MTKRRTVPEITEKVHRGDAVVLTAKELCAVLAQRYPEPGPRFLHVLVKPGNAAVANVPLTAEAIKQRFLAALRCA